MLQRKKMESLISNNKPEIAKKLNSHVNIKQNLQELLENLNPEEISDIFFTILGKADNVSAISEKAALMGFAENNMIFKGKTDNPGDHISISRWAKAASGSLIIPLRYDSNGDPEILFGKKNGLDTWVLPGGHYELDEHKNLDHTLIAELMEETSIIPYSDKFLPYIKSTIEHIKDKNILPYKTIEEARSSFVSYRFSCHLETILSGGDLGYNKRIILAVYSIIFHDGEYLQYRANDDIAELRWFPLKEILAGDKERNFSLSKLLPAHYKALKHTLTRMNHF